MYALDMYKAPIYEFRLGRRPVSILPSNGSFWFILHRRLICQLLERAAAPFLAKLSCGRESARAFTHYLIRPRVRLGWINPASDSPHHGSRLSSVIVYLPQLCFSFISRTFHNKGADGFMWGLSLERRSVATTHVGLT